jgi:hypothetical protein
MICFHPSGVEGWSPLEVLVPQGLASQRLPGHVSLPLRFSPLTRPSSHQENTISKEERIALLHMLDEYDRQLKVPPPLE